ncbi:MAG: acyltransferase, partial [Pseudomonadota bacterium]
MRAVDYRADIDGLRAIAILLVVIFHFDILSAGEGGFIGVDVFFVISGFLITGIIARALDAGTFRIGDFLYRRVRRLYPAVLATLILYLAFGYVFFLPDLFEELAVQALLSQIYAINIYFWRTIDYFGLQAGSAPLLHMWSLAVEEQFYLLFPVFCLICHRILRGRLLWPLIAITALSFALGLAASGWKPQAAFYLLPTRAWELSAGGALALLLRDWTPPRFVAVAAGPIGLALIVAALAVHTPAMAVPGWFALLPVTGAMLLLVTGAHPDAPVARVLALKPMVWVGLISYPLYLVHWPVIIALDEMVEVAHLGWRLFGLGLSFALAWAIWKVVETPVRTSRVLPRPAPFL